MDPGLVSPLGEGGDDPALEDEQASDVHRADGRLDLVVPRGGFPAAGRWFGCSCAQRGHMYGNVWSVSLHKFSSPILVRIPMGLVWVGMDWVGLGRPYGCVRGYMRYVGGCFLPWLFLSCGKRRRFVSDMVSKKSTHEPKKKVN